MNGKKRGSRPKTSALRGYSFAMGLWNSDEELVSIE
jgi:hypothetical protein